MADRQTRAWATAALDRLGRWAALMVAEVGLAATLLGESLVWLVVGHRRRQPVRLDAVVAQAMEVGLGALPILTLLSATIGIMLAIQGIYTLRAFGAESRVTQGIALSVVREFAPLMTGILMAGRSGSALAARLGTMTIDQEIDALRVMGIEPVRFLVSPAVAAMAVMGPALTVWSMIVALGAAGLYVTAAVDLTAGDYLARVQASLALNDLWHGLSKSALFAVLTTVVGVVNGVTVTAGAEGVGRATTRAVVQAISAIVVTDMVFAFALTR